MSQAGGTGDDDHDMSVVILTAAELAVLSTMLGGLLHKRAHLRKADERALPTESR